MSSLNDQPFIYLDYAATAPLVGAAADAMSAYLDAGGAACSDANANSLHTPGRQAFSALESARNDVARCLGVRPPEIVFTGGATEADNMALRGFVLAHAGGKSQDKRVHIVTTSIEHDAIYRTACALQAEGLAEVSFARPTRSGHVDPEEVARLVTSDTVLVSVMAANNETGAINDIAALVALAHDNGALFHTDAVQYVGKGPLDLAALSVDLASISAHKIGGPKGVGALFVKRGTRILPAVHGGGQEFGLRSGTQNVCGIVGFAAALKASLPDGLVDEGELDRQRELRDILYRGLLSHEGVHATTECLSRPDAYAPHIVNVCVEGLESETMILKFDDAGIAVSGGSACSTHSLDPSRILLEMGIDKDLALGSLRISIGQGTTLQDVERCLEAFDSIVSLRKKGR